MGGVKSGVFACVCGRTPLNLSTLGPIFPSSLLVSLTRSPFHLSFARIPLCNCALIFQCQSGLRPQPYYLLHSQPFSHFFATFLQSLRIFFFPLAAPLPPLDCFFPGGRCVRLSSSSSASCTFCPIMSTCAHLCVCVRAPVCARSAPLCSVRAICLVCL